MKKGILGLIGSIFNSSVGANILSAENGHTATIEINNLSVVKSQVKKSQKLIVEQIHSEFNKASDNAIAESKKILGQLPDISDDADILERIGFANAKSVVQNKQVKESKINAQYLAAIVLYWQQKLPTHKFITADQVTEICEKYGLVWGGIGLYKGEVPSKNVKEMSIFHSNNPITIEDRRYCKQYRNYNFPFSTSSNVEIPYSQFKLVDAAVQRGMREVEEHFYEDKQYMICAPEKDMHVDRSRVDSKTKMLVDDDPIVLYPVRGGYIVVSAWGAESEIVINEKMN